MNFSTIATAILTGGVFAFLQFLISRSDSKDEEKKSLKKDIKEIKDKLIKNEKDTLRTQMLILILMKPEETHEILTIGERYFKILNGNWYMTSIFNKWLKDNKVAEPEWLNKEN